MVNAAHTCTHAAYVLLQLKPPGMVSEHPALEQCTVCCSPPKAQGQPNRAKVTWAGEGKGGSLGAGFDGASQLIRNGTPSTHVLLAFLAGHDLAWA